jgi:hypothetical protein
MLREDSMIGPVREQRRMAKRKRSGDVEAREWKGSEGEWLQR